MSDRLFFLVLFSCSFLVVSSCKVRNKTIKNKNDILFNSQYRGAWSATSDHWWWEEDILIGETTNKNPLERSSFFIWEHEVSDFILHISFRISSHGNSGIYYRGERGPTGYDDLLGYQADIDGQNVYTGIVYENFVDRSREILAGQGQYVFISEKDKVAKTTIKEDGDFQSGLIRKGEWNDYEILAIGPVIIHKINGEIITIVEDHAEDRKRKGLFGFQLHQGPPMKVEFRNAKLVDLK